MPQRNGQNQSNFLKTLEIFGGERLDQALGSFNKPGVRTQPLAVCRRCIPRVADAERLVRPQNQRSSAASESGMKLPVLLLAFAMQSAIAADVVVGPVKSYLQAQAPIALPKGSVTVVNRLYRGKIENINLGVLAVFASNPDPAQWDYFGALVGRPDECLGPPVYSHPNRKINNQLRDRTWAVPNPEQKLDDHVNVGNGQTELLGYLPKSSCIPTKWIWHAVYETAPAKIVGPGQGPADGYLAVCVRQLASSAGHQGCDTTPYGQAFMEPGLQ